MTARPPAALPACGKALEALRGRGPRVHCITNSVVQNFTANGLLALGAVPSMTINPAEIADFVAGADALLINLGTVDDERRAAIPLALKAAEENGLPVVLDPVFIDRSPGRAELARRLFARGPAIVRGNAGEWATLLGERPAGAASVEAVAAGLGAGDTVAVVSGARDMVVDRNRSMRVAGGDPLMARVTGVGCVQSALMAALAAVADTAFDAALAGTLILSICGERAAGAAGPGSFQVQLLDALYRLSPAELQARLDDGEHSR